MRRLHTVNPRPRRSALVVPRERTPPAAASTTSAEIYVNFDAPKPGLGSKLKPFNAWSLVLPFLPAKGSGLPGPTVYLRGITATTLTLTSVGGTSYAPIRLVLWPDPGATLLIDGQQPRDSGQWPIVPAASAITAGIALADCEHIEIDGTDPLRSAIRGIAGIGIAAAGCDRIVVRNLTVDWTAQSGMLFTNDGDRTCPNVDLLVEGCSIDHTNLGSVPSGAQDCSALDLGTEALSIVNYDGFEVRCCQVSNSLTSGIGVSGGALHGRVHHNVVELARVNGIAVQEAYFADIYMNVVRSIGYHRVIRDTQAFFNAAAWLTIRALATVGQRCDFASRSAGILVANGGLGCQSETGTVSNLRIYQNEIYWTAGSSITVLNRWRSWKTLGVTYPCTPSIPTWPPDEGEIYGIEILHNVCCKAQQVEDYTPGAALELDGTMRSSQVKDNMIVATSHRALGGLMIVAGTGTPWLTQIDIASNYYFDNGPNGATHAEPFWAVGKNPTLGTGTPFVAVPQGVGSTGDFRLLATTNARRAGTVALFYPPGYQPGTTLPYATREVPDLGAHPSLDLLPAGNVDWVVGLGCQDLSCFTSVTRTPHTPAGTA